MGSVSGLRRSRIGRGDLHCILSFLLSLNILHGAASVYATTSIYDQLGSLKLFPDPMESSCLFLTCVRYSVNQATTSAGQDWIVGLFEKCWIQKFTDQHLLNNKFGLGFKGAHSHARSVFCQNKRNMKLNLKMFLLAAEVPTCSILCKHFWNSPRNRILSTQETSICIDKF